MKRSIIITLLFFSANNVFGQTSNFLWAKGMGGTGDHRGYSITIDASGAILQNGM